MNIDYEDADLDANAAAAALAPHQPKPSAIGGLEISPLDCIQRARTMLTLLQTYVIFGDNRINS